MTDTATNAANKDTKEQANGQAKEKAKARAKKKGNQHGVSNRRKTKTSGRSKMTGRKGAKKSVERWKMCVKSGLKRTTLGR